MINQQQIGSILNHHSQVQYQQDNRQPCYVDEDFSEWRISSYPRLPTKKSQFFPQISCSDTFIKQDKLYIPAKKIVNQRKYSFLRGILCISNDQHKNKKHVSQSQNKPSILIPKRVRLSLPSAYQVKQRLDEEKLINKKTNYQTSTLKKMPFSYVKIKQKRNASMLEKLSDINRDILSDLKQMDKQHKKGRIQTFFNRRKLTNRQHKPPKQKQYKFMCKQCIKPINFK